MFIFLEVIHQSYLFYCLNSDIIQNQINKNLAYNKGAQPGLNREHINSIYIPLLSLGKQQKIIEELNSYQKII
nr:restriction endonuclease subunit S [Rickettsia sp. Tenjiku01]